MLLSYETVRRWCRNFGEGSASRLRRRRPRPADKWHLNAVLVRIQGELHYLWRGVAWRGVAWRGVDRDRIVLDILVQSRRDAKAAKRFFLQLLRGLQYVLRVLVTDKLRSDGAAKRERLSDVEHRQSRYINDPAENSHRPTHRRERQMQCFKSPGQAQEFLSAHAVIYGLLPSASPSYRGQQLSRGQDRGIPDLAAGDGCPQGGVICAIMPASVPSRPPAISVTMPAATVRTFILFRPAIAPARVAEGGAVVYRGRRPRAGDAILSRRAGRPS